MGPFYIIVQNASLHASSVRLQRQRTALEGTYIPLSVAYKASLTFSGLCALAGELFSKRFSCRPDLRRQFWRDRALMCTGAPRAALVRAAQALNSTGEVLRDIYFVAGDSICG